MLNTMSALRSILAAAVLAIGFVVVPLGATTAAHADPNPLADHHRVIVYYQKVFADGTGEYISPLPLLTEGTGVDVVNLAAVHMNSGELLLNDWLPSDPRFDQMWTELRTMQDAGIRLIGMIGGAMNESWENLQSDFDIQYPRLKAFIDAHGLDGIDLDVETETDLATVEAVITSLRADYGQDFLITMSPVAPALAGDDMNLSGFDYDTLYERLGADIDWFNLQFYCNWGEPTPEYYDAVVSYQVEHGANVPPSKLVLATVTNPDNCAGWIPLDQLQGSIRALSQSHPDFGGIAGWEYFNSLPGGTEAPWEWAALVRTTLDEELLAASPQSKPAVTSEDGPGVVVWAVVGAVAIIGVAAAVAVTMIRLRRGGSGE